VLMRLDPAMVKISSSAGVLWKSSVGPVIMKLLPELD